MNFILPKIIEDIVKHKIYTLDNIGQSVSTVICYDDMVLKIENEGEESNNEHRILKWLQNKILVPKIICSHNENGKNYLLMSRLDGKMLCDDSQKDEEQVVSLLAQSLNILWDVDIKDCPYRNDLDNKLRLAKLRVDNNLCDTNDAEPFTYGEGGFKNPLELLLWLEENKPKQELVFSHGDFCLPNIFSNNNEISGFIDLGRSGIADKWQDLALCYRSFKSNFKNKGENAIDNLFSILNIQYDYEKIKYYILLDELF